MTMPVSSGVMTAKISGIATKEEKITLIADMVQTVWH
jgi:hypothetical protein